MDDGKNFGSLIKEHLFVLVSLAILATYMLYAFITDLAGYNGIVHGIIMLFVCSAALGNAAICFIKTKSVSVEVVFALAAVIVTFLHI